jgi:hypothetical protein
LQTSIAAAAVPAEEVAFKPQFSFADAPVPPEEFALYAGAEEASDVQRAEAVGFEGEVAGEVAGASPSALQTSIAAAAVPPEEVAFKPQFSCADAPVPPEEFALNAGAEEASDVQRAEAVGFEPTVTKPLPSLVHSPAAEAVPPEEIAFQSFGGSSTRHDGDDAGAGTGNFVQSSGTLSPQQ